jgi:hypothetical protein
VLSETLHCDLLLVVNTFETIPVAMISAVVLPRCSDEQKRIEGYGGEPRRIEGYGGEPRRIEDCSDEQKQIEGYGD